MTKTVTNIMADQAQYPFKLCKVRDYDKSLKKIWHVEYYIWDQAGQKLKRRRVNLSQKTKEQRYAYAKEVVADINKVLKKGAFINPVKVAVTKVAKKNTLQENIDYFLELKKRTLRPNSFSSCRTDCSRFNKFLDWLDAIPSAQSFNVDHATQFSDYLILKLKISNRSRNNTINTISTLFNFLKSRKIILENPFEALTKLPTEAKKHTAFTKQQADLLKAEIIKAKDHQLLLFISFIYYCALRPRTELLTLKIEDIQSGIIKIKAQHAKNRTTEFVKIPKPLVDILDHYKIFDFPQSFYLFGKKDQPQPEPLFENSLYQRHQRFLKKCKLENKHLDTYSWKHTGVIALWQATKDIELIRTHCRHKDLGTSIKYLRDLGLFADNQKLDQFPEL